MYQSEIHQENPKLIDDASDELSEDDDIEDVFHDAYDFIPSTSIKITPGLRDKSIVIKNWRASQRMSSMSRTEDEFKECFDNQEDLMKV